MGKPSVLVKPEVKGKDVLVQARVAQDEKKRLRVLARASGLNEREILIPSVGSLMSQNHLAVKKLIENCSALNEAASENDEMVQFWVSLPFKRRMKQFAALNELKLREVVLLALSLHAADFLTKSDVSTIASRV